MTTIGHASDGLPAPRRAATVKCKPYAPRTGMTLLRRRELPTTHAFCSVRGVGRGHRMRRVVIDRRHGRCRIHRRRLRSRDHRPRSRHRKQACHHIRPDLHTTFLTFGVPRGHGSCRACFRPCCSSCAHEPPALPVRGPCGESRGSWGVDLGHAQREGPAGTTLRPKVTSPTSEADARTRRRAANRR